MPYIITPCPLLAFIMTQWCLVTFWAFSFDFLVVVLVGHAGCVVIRKVYFVVNIQAHVLHDLGHVCNTISMNWMKPCLSNICPMVLSYFTLILLGYNPHCVLCLGFTTNGPRRSWRRCYLPNVETKRDATARHPIPHLTYRILAAFLRFCTIEPSYSMLISVDFNFISWAQSFICQ